MIFIFFLQELKQLLVHSHFDNENLLKENSLTNFISIDTQVEEYGERLNIKQINCYLRIFTIIN
jgi:hypothetical protein